MAIDRNAILERLKAFGFGELFTQQLGWDFPPSANLTVEVDDQSYELAAVAEKRGLVVYRCAPGSTGEIPSYPVRRKIERLVARSVREHLIIFCDADRSTQTWQWVKRESGKPDSCREHTVYPGQSGEALVQKLDPLMVTLDEEEDITLPDVLSRTRKGFDVERVTRRFYDRFKKEHAAFLKFIQGLREQGDREWYASIMLNRLMFLYFIQKKGFLDGDPDYLRNRLKMVQQRKGRDRFLSFYRYFLLRLMHEGLGQLEGKRKPDLDGLIGNVPYLNGGIFDPHPLVMENADIDIPDDAFERIFGFFDEYQWHLDDRPLRSDREINPDVLGYIFEKYINQKQMGAYYTREDITEYIGKNTILPFLFDAARKKCPAAFEPDSALWGLLRDDPDRYIYDAVRKGVVGEQGEVRPLPPEIEAGVSDVSRRGGWNRSADPEYALSTETWREHAARRKRCLEIRRRLAAGEITSIDDLITLNLDIRQFVQDAVETCEAPDLLRAFYRAVETVTVLDPTCGSGAFLFAALNILEPLYEACLERMQLFVDDLDRSGKPHRPEKFSDFRNVLKRADDHPNRRYFIYKSIILNNLYGVDIMQEAVEICKLRLFLKLVAQVQDAALIEPLPDIDFNIRAGNTLIGFASFDEVRQILEGDLVEKLQLPRIEEQTEIADRAFRMFRRQQTELGGEVTPEDKQQLRGRLKALEEELNRYLARRYGIYVEKRGQKTAYRKWLATHQPFHWFVDFYGVMKKGGFDVIIGNPPYIVYPNRNVHYDVSKAEYITLSAKNLYAFVFERSFQVAKALSPIGLIVQLTSLSSERLGVLQDLLLKRGSLQAIPFPRRPQSVFEGVEMPVAILLSLEAGQGRTATSRINRFYSEERTAVMGKLSLCAHSIQLYGHRIAKLSSQIETSILGKMQDCKKTISVIATRAGKGYFYYQEACRYWVKALSQPPRFIRNGEAIKPPHGRTIALTSNKASAFVTCLVNSSLFYWYYSVFSDCEHINDSLIRQFPIPDQWQKMDWEKVCRQLDTSLCENAQRKSIKTRQGHIIEYDEINAALSKPIIDEIDRVLARHYGFTDEELDFIINYDIKYRMGLDE